MRRRVAIAAIFIAVVLALGLYVFSSPQPVPDNPYFGLSGTIPTPRGTKLKLIEGGDLFEVTYYGMRPDCYANAGIGIIPKISGKTYMRGGSIWRDGKAEITDYQQGRMELINDGRVVHSCELTEKFDRIWGKQLAIPIPSREDGGLEYSAFLLPVTCYQGTLRITLYVRECEVIDEKQGKFTSVGDVIPITFEIKNPYATDKLFDIVSFEYQKDHPEYNRLQYTVLRIRRNGPSFDFPYLDTQSVQVARKGIFGYTDIPAEELIRRDSVSRYFMYPGMLGDDYANQELSYAVYYIPMPNYDTAIPGEYRLTLVFYENEDGSGEQYTLTLNLRFDE